MVTESLHRETTADGGSRSVWVSRSTDGGASIEGQDLGDLEEFFGIGVREYEWAHSVAKEEVPALVAALGGTDDVEVVQLVKAKFAGVRHSEFSTFCQDHGVEVTFWSRFGE